MISRDNDSPPVGMTWDEEDYLKVNPDVAAAVREKKLSSGYQHWISYGKQEGRGPSWKLQAKRLIDKRSKGKTVPLIDNPKPQVVFFTPALFMGGAERWIVSLVKNFIEVDPLCIITIMGDADIRMETEVVKHTRLVKNSNGAKSLAVIDEICKDKADIILSWGCPNLPLLTAHLSCPVVEVSHSDPAWARHKSLIERSCLGATHYVGVSGVTGTAFPPQYKDKVEILYNGVECDRITPRMGRDLQRWHWDLFEEDKVILFLGRLSDEKRPLLALDSLSYLPENYKLHFAGRGPLEEVIKKNPFYSTGRVRILNTTPHVGDYLAAADVLVIPSIIEGMSLTLLEAWLSGIPVVSTEYASFLELMEKYGQISWGVPVHSSPHTLSEQIVKAALEGRDSPRVQTAKQIAWKEHTASVMAYRWERFIKKTLEGWESSRFYKG